AESTRLARFMRSLGIGTLAELQRRSVADPDWYWNAVVRDLGLRFTRPYTRVRDVSHGLPWPRWFEGGLMNFAENCVDRHLDAGRSEQPAIVWEGDDGLSRSLTYRELAREVNQLANALKRLRGREGDRVGVFLPMSPELGARRGVRHGIAGGADRNTRGRADRRHLHPVLLRLRRPGRCLAASGLRSQGAGDGRRLLSPRSDREDKGDRRRGGGRVAVGRARGRLQAARPRDSLECRARSLVARADPQGIGRRPGAAGLIWSPAPPHLS